MKSALYLLDTSVLLALVRGNELGKFIRHTFSLENPAIRSLNKHCFPRRDMGNGGAAQLAIKET